MTDELDPHARRFIDMLSLRTSASVAGLDIAARRAAFATLMRFSAPGKEVGSIEDIAGPRPMRLYRPKTNSRSALLFIHGGGLVAGSLETHDALCRTFTAVSCCNLIAVDYRLAPEHPFPAALEDVLAALSWLFDEAPRLGVDHIGLGGDSAGGTLAAVAAAHWRARKPELAFLFLLCPILDFAGKRPSRAAFGSSILDQETLDHDITLYTQGRIAIEDSSISPLRAKSVAGLPPTFLHSAECDPLRDENADYAARLRDAGVDVHDTCHAGMPHLFYGLTSVIPAAKIRLQHIGAELRGWLKRRSSA